jgi:hypothetical protein
LFLREQVVAIRNKEAGRVLDEGVDRVIAENDALSETEEPLIAGGCCNLDKESGQIVGQHEVGNESVLVAEVMRSEEALIKQHGGAGYCCYQGSCAISNKV